MHKIVRIVGCLLLFLSLSGCYTASMMQTAKTLDKGERELTIGAGPYTSSGDFLVCPDFMLRWGYSDKSDFGLMYSLQLNGHFRGDWKREIWSNANQTSFLSTGAMAELFLPNDFAGDPTYFGLGLPVYYSFNHDKKWVPYFGQRFSLGLGGLSIVRYAGVNEPIEENVNIYHDMYYSGAVGVRFGKRRLKGFLEASYSVKMGNRFYNYWYSNDNIQEWRLSRGYDGDVNLQLTLGLALGRKQK